MIEKLHTFGKFLDQPMLISKFERSMPLILGSGATAFYLKDSYDTFKNSKDKNDSKRTILSHAIVAISAVTSALMAPKMLLKLQKDPCLIRLKQ